MLWFYWFGLVWFFYHMCANLKIVDWEFIALINYLITVDIDLFCGLEIAEYLIRDFLHV